MRCWGTTIQLLAGTWVPSEEVKGDRVFRGTPSSRGAVSSFLQVESEPQNEEMGDQAGE